MSSEEEATAANVLSQMSQIQQINACDTIEASVVVGHHCDVETTGIPVETTAQQHETTTTTVEVTADVLQQVHAAFQHQVQEQLQTAATSLQTAYIEVSKADSHTHEHVLSDGMPCTVCTKTTITQGGKSYTCEHCGKKFNKSYNLKTHIRVHTGERPYQCEVCGHGFANLGDLKRHARTHTGEKPFKCEHCEKVFSDFGSHKRHIRLHTGYKPFKCEQCDREFTRLDSYKNHIRLHTGDRPYKCDTCGKEFNYLTTYKRHLNIHRGEKPYACTLCDKKFTRQNYLKNHLNTHSKNCQTECQTDLTALVKDETLPGAEELEDMETSEGHTAAENLNRVESLDDTGTEDADKAVTDSESPSKASESKAQDASLLQQVTQVLGEIIPHNVSAEVMEGAGGPQIVVQGADQAGGEFKITLAQQLLIAQHILNQANMQQRSGNGEADNGNDNDQPQITAVTIPDISPELAEQIVNQAGLQRGGDQSQDDIQVIELSTNRTGSSSEGGDQEIIVDGQIVTQEQISEVMSRSDGITTEQVMDESFVAVTSVDGTRMVSGDAVYVAIDPSQPEVQHILGQIQMAQDSESAPVTQAGKKS